MAAKDTKYYVLECAVEGCNAEFYLNDVPIVLRGDEYGKFYAGQCNQHLVDGVNEISILINPGPTPGESISGLLKERTPLTPDKEAKAGAILALYPYGAVTGGPQRKPLMSAHWLPRKEGLEEIFPKVVSASHDLGPLFGEFDWHKTETLTLDSETMSEAEDLLNDLHQSMLSGDPEPYIKTSKPILKSVERAYGLKPGAKEKLIRLGTRSDSRQPWWGLEPIDPAAFDFRLCGQNRLLEVLNKNWEPVLKEFADDEGGVSTYPMFIGRLEGEMRIVL